MTSTPMMSCRDPALVHVLCPSSRHRVDYAITSRAFRARQERPSVLGDGDDSGPVLGRVISPCGFGTAQLGAPFDLFSSYRSSRLSFYKCLFYFWCGWACSYARVVVYGCGFAT